MSIRALTWGTLGFAVAVGVVVLALQRQETVALRDELSLWRGSGGDLEKLRTENERLRARQISPEELAALRVDRSALEEKRRQIEVLKQRLRDAK